MTMFQLIKYDVDQDEAVRDEKGHCIPVVAGKFLFVTHNQMNMSLSHLSADLI